MIHHKIANDVIRLDVIWKMNQLNADNSDQSNVSLIALSVARRKQ